MSLNQTKNNDIIKKDLIFIKEKMEDKTEAINLIVDEAFNKEIISDKDELLNSILKREEETSTSVGLSVAIPHGKIERIKEPFIGFIKLKKELIWNEDKVRLIFMIVVPKENKNNMHLKFISELSKNLVMKDFREKVLAATSKEELYEIFKNIDF